MLWRAYHVGTNDNVEDQVNTFLSVIGQDTKGIVFSLNLLEHSTKSTNMTLSQAKEFLNQLQSKTAHIPLVYGSSEYLKHLIGDDKESAQTNPLWIEYYSKIMINLLFLVLGNGNCSIILMENKDLNHTQLLKEYLLIKIFCMAIKMICKNFGQILHHNARNHVICILLQNIIIFRISYAN